MKLKGKVTVVTGGNSGIGFGRRLLKAKARLVQLQAEIKKHSTVRFSSLEMILSD